MSTSEMSSGFTWIPPYHPDAPTVVGVPAVGGMESPTVVAMPVVDHTEPQTLVFETAPDFLREAHFTGSISLLDQANFGVHSCLDKEVANANHKLRTGIGKEGQLAHEDWGLVVGLLRDRDQRELNREQALALAAATVDDRLKRSATGAYVTGAVTLAEVFNAPDSTTGKIEVPAVNVEDLQNFTRLMLYEGFAALSSDPWQGGQKLHAALQTLLDSVRHVPGFDADKAGFQALLGRAIYYKAAFPNVRGYEDEPTKLVRKCFMAVREVLTLHALEQMKEGATVKDIEASILTDDQ